jgi:vacuolar-type H+-ATPase subunit E/Vma4
MGAAGSAEGGDAAVTGARVDGTARDASAPMREALAPARDALLVGAREQAGQTLAAARKDADATVRAARREADAILAEACAAGEADGRATAAAEGSAVRRRARALVLAAQCELYEELCRQVRAGVRGLRADPCYPALVERLTRLARRRLGAAAAVEEAAGGGIVARAPDAEIDLSADALAERAVADLGAEVMRLWAPSMRARG